MKSTQLVTAFRGNDTENVKMLHTDLLKDSPGMSAERDSFKASRELKRSGIHSVVRLGEAASSNKEAVIICDRISRICRGRRICSQQVFSCDETGLCWKEMAKRTYITQEKSLLDTSQWDRLTSLLCGNASGDFKSKPLLIYHSENLQIFKTNVMQNKFNKMRRATLAGLTQWIEHWPWIHGMFVPSVKKYLQEKQLPLRTLLVKDSAPGHLHGLKACLVEADSCITDRVISNFKKLYTKALFQRCFRVTSETNLTLSEFWREPLISSFPEPLQGGSASQDYAISLEELWPESVALRDFEGFEDKPVTVVQDIVSLGESMVDDDDDVEELVEDHNIKLTFGGSSHRWQLRSSLQKKRREGKILLFH
ncbi:LOW QUALITY PROTEIN: hypothetical protein QTO34_007971 [Cnephaeus nilssonii]|uniref:DDE-1 domain-containing protein n=1 Tax=Cnephaeus nilssonii TaxID=3371016 RepID=A0AA40I9J2_CNENI|nr:LOW QUALITY PROTEIN: hypothetical protein QTO34_007971 [Eptesicus nilssonii]